MLQTFSKITLLLGFITPFTYADTIGGEISLGLFSHAPSGIASYQSSATVDLEDDLYWDTEQDLVLKAYFEHPLPFIPNIKAEYSDLSHSGSGTVYQFNWGDIIDFSGTLDNNMDLKMYDMTLYYELLDNQIVEADLGVTLRYIDGTIDMRATPVSGTLSATYEAVDFSGAAPMLYTKLRAYIPSTDIALQFEGNGISYEDTTFFDYEISARYTFAMGIGIEAGYRLVHLDSSDLEDGLYVDADFQGPYASVVWDF